MDVVRDLAVTCYVLAPLGRHRHEVAHAEVAVVKAHTVDGVPCARGLGRGAGVSGAQLQITYFDKFPTGTSQRN